MSPILIGFWIRLNCLDVYNITRLKNNARTKNVRFGIIALDTNYYLR
jgi:hypothetical protein